MDKNLSPTKYATASEMNPGYITIHLMGNRYTLQERVVVEIVRQILPLIPLPILDPEIKRKKIATMFLAVFWLVCAVVLWNESFTASAETIVKWFYFLSAVQSLSFVYLIWKGK
jgi:hypothetical protein